MLGFCDFPVLLWLDIIAVALKRGTGGATIGATTASLYYFRGRRCGETVGNKWSRSPAIINIGRSKREGRGRKGKIIKILKKRKTKNQVMNALSTDRFASPVRYPRSEENNIILFWLDPEPLHLGEATESTGCRQGSGWGFHLFLFFFSPSHSPLACALASCLLATYVLPSIALCLCWRQRLAAIFQLPSGVGSKPRGRTVSTRYGCVKMCGILFDQLGLDLSFLTNF